MKSSLAGFHWTAIPHETVHVLASHAALQQARSMVGAIENVVLHDVPTNDAWIRDYGPRFIDDGVSLKVELRKVRAGLVARRNGWASSAFSMTSQ